MTYITERVDINSTNNFINCLEERGHLTTLICETEEEFNRIRRGLLHAPSSGENDDDTLLLISDYYDQVWLDVLTKCIESIFQQGVKELY